MYFDEYLETDAVMYISKADDMTYNQLDQRNTEYVSHLRSVYISDLKMSVRCSGVIRPNLKLSGEVFCPIPICKTL